MQASRRANERQYLTCGSETATIKPDAGPRERSIEGAGDPEDVQPSPSVHGVAAKEMPSGRLYCVVLHKMESVFSSEEQLT